MKLKQIVISIENALGRLYEVTRALGDAGINLRALSLVDTGAFGQLRLLVSDVAKARRILMGMQIPAFVNEVLVAEIEDKPGSLAKVLKMVKDANIQVTYMYAFTGFSVGNAIMVFCFSDNDGAIEVLQANNVNLLDAKAFGILENENKVSRFQ
ncbi:MAG: amino acid-binding protein [Deltaproteobacteria bacterium]|nr:amino acid-binding protein [Deltaproteobacteria bacterium]